MKTLINGVITGLLLWALIFILASCSNACKVTKARPMGYTYKTAKR